MKKFQRKKILSIALCIAGIGIVGSVGLWYVLFVRTEHRIPELADRVLAQCKDAGYRPVCYENEVPKLMSRISMEDAFSVTKVIQDKDPEYLYCHVLAHKISFEEAKRHPGTWKDTMQRCPIGMCNYGCPHGAMIQQFRGESMTDTEIIEALPDLSDVCEPRGNYKPSDIDKTMCYHGIGHLTMYMTAGKPDRAAEICAKVGAKPDGRNYVQTCTGGVFMTVFQGVDPEDIALVKDIKPTRETVNQFCNTYPRYITECHRQSFPLFGDDLKKPEGLLQFCSYAQDQETLKECYLTVMNVFVDTTFTNVEEGVAKATLYCQGIPNDRRGTCFAGAAMRLVQIEPLRHINTAVSVCEQAKKEGVEEECYEGLIYYATFGFSRGSENIQSYCEQLPEQWRLKCGT